jgi:hypothetical protein
MNSRKFFSKARHPGAFVLVLLGAILAGCESDADRPRQGNVYVEPPVVGAVFIGQDDYVYYPAYECYYSVSRNQYAYREGNAWVSRPAPPGVEVSVLRASPSVKMDFHDSPQNHHAAVVQKYPKNWSPPGANQGPDANPKNYESNNGK